MEHPFFTFVHTVAAALKEFEDGGVAMDRCTDVCEVVRAAADCFGINLRIGVATVPGVRNGAGHNVLLAHKGQVVVDYTLNQFFRAEPKAFPWVVGAAFYHDVQDMDEDYDWTVGLHPDLLRKVFAALLRAGFERTAAHEASQVKISKRRSRKNRRPRQLRVGNC